MDKEYTQKLESIAKAIRDRARKEHSCLDKKETIIGSFSPNKQTLFFSCPKCKQCLAILDLDSLEISYFPETLQSIGINMIMVDVVKEALEKS